MKIVKRALLGLGLGVLLILAWIVAITTPSQTQKQEELIAQANLLVEDEIYIRAMPLLEEAITYKGEKTIEAESLLKAVYLELMGQSGIKNKYVALLDNQMNSPDVTADVFSEAANFYIGTNKLSEGLTVLKRGIEKLNEQSLIDFYEAQRYVFQLNRVAYADATAIVNDRIQICEDDLWGIANSDGSLLIPCRYDKISNYDNSRAIVLKGNEVYAVDSSVNRIALLQENASNIGNYGNDRIGILTNEGWKRATGDLVVGSVVFDEIGMYSDGYAAAKQGGKWGVVDVSSEWLLPAEYNEIISDELGRVYAQGAVFVRKDNEAVLFVDGMQVGNTYEDARPFNESGWAAVRQNGKWGFIDTTGEFKIKPQYDDALSFSGHLAAVKEGELWGYVALTEKIVIAPQFLEAKSFSNGNAPVLTERGWQFISLLEYQKGAGL